MLPWRCGNWIGQLSISLQLGKHHSLFTGTLRLFNWCLDWSFIKQRRHAVEPWRLGLKVQLAFLGIAGYGKSMVAFKTLKSENWFAYIDWSPCLVYSSTLGIAPLFGKTCDRNNFYLLEHFFLWTLIGLLSFLCTLKQVAGMLLNRDAWLQASLNIAK